MIKKILIGAGVGFVVSVLVAIAMIHFKATDFNAGWVGGTIFSVILYSAINSYNHENK